MPPTLRLYLDVDGVLLGEVDRRATLAAHTDEFLRFVLPRFDVYWLTTHCAGESQRVLDYLRPHTPPATLDLMGTIKPTRFDVLKTEVLVGDYYWVDDSPLRSELDELRRRGHFDRWIEVNTRKRIDDLRFARDELAGVLGWTPSGRPT